MYSLSLQMLIQHLIDTGQYSGSQNIPNHSVACYTQRNFLFNRRKLVPDTKRMAMKSRTWQVTLTRTMRVLGVEKILSLWWHMLGERQRKRFHRTKIDWTEMNWMNKVTKDVKNQSLSNGGRRKFVKRDERWGEEYDGCLRGILWFQEAQHKWAA